MTCCRNTTNLLAINDNALLETYMNCVQLISLSSKKRENKLSAYYNIMSSPIPFWSNSPTILFDKSHFLEFYPTSSMNFESKLNALSRSIIVVTILGFLITSQLRVLFAGILTMMGIFFLYKFRKNRIISSATNSSSNNKEPFTANNDPNNAHNKNPKKNRQYNREKNNQMTTDPITLEKVLKSNYYDSGKKNPLGNVLLTEIGDDPNRKSAPPAFNPDVYEDINSSVMKTIQYLNPSIKNTNKQLFGDLWQNYEFENSTMRPFFSTANTKVTQDQGAFAQYLYGNMPSCKEGDAFACVKANVRHEMI